MIPRTREEKFLHRGSVARVLHHGSTEDYAHPFLGINHRNGSKNKRGDFPTSWNCWKGPMLRKHRRMCWSIVGYQAPQRFLEQRRRSSYIVKVRGRSYIVEAWKIVRIRCYVSSTTMISRIKEEKFLKSESVERVLRRGSKEDWANSFLGINHHDDS